MLVLSRSVGMGFEECSIRLLPLLLRLLHSMTGFAEGVFLDELKASDDV